MLSETCASSIPCLEERLPKEMNSTLKHCDKIHVQLKKLTRCSAVKLICCSVAYGKLLMWIQEEKKKHWNCISSLFSWSRFMISKDVCMLMVSCDMQQFFSATYSQWPMIFCSRDLRALSITSSFISLHMLWLIVCRDVAGLADIRLRFESCSARPDGSACGPYVLKVFVGKRIQLLVQPLDGIKWYMNFFMSEYLVP